MSYFFPHQIVFEDKFVGTQLEFPVDRWLDEDEDDGDRVRELPAQYPGEEPLPGEHHLGWAKNWYMYFNGTCTLNQEKK